MLAILANRATFGQPVVSRSIRPVVATPAAPMITILTATTGAMVRSVGRSASVDLGRVSYFGGTAVPGVSSHKNPGSFVISTKFALKVDCPGRPALSEVKVTIARLDADVSNVITVDGTTVGIMPQILAQSMPCGSGGEHRLDVEVLVSTPAGSIGSTIAFTATIVR